MTIRWIPYLGLALVALVGVAAPTLAAPQDDVPAARLPSPPPPPPPPLPSAAGVPSPAAPRTLADPLPGMWTSTETPLVRTRVAAAPSAALVEQAVAACCPPDEPVPACEDPWAFWVSLALGLGQGNSDFFDVNAAAGFEHVSGPWNVEFEVSYVYGEKDGDLAANRWNSKLRGERDLTARSYAFGQVLFDSDELADLDYRFNINGGYGRHLIETNRIEWNGEVGAGMVIEQRSGLPQTIDPAGYLSSDFTYTWPDGKEFSAEVDFLPNLGDFDLSLTTVQLRFGCPLFGACNLEVKFRMDWVIDPPGDTEPVDTLLNVGLRFRF